jgi:hypothetical protein
MEVQLKPLDQMTPIEMIAELEQARRFVVASQQMYQENLMLKTILFQHGVLVWPQHYPNEGENMHG